MLRERWHLRETLLSLLVGVPLLLVACDNAEDGANSPNLPAPYGIQDRTPHVAWVLPTPTATWARPQPTVTARCTGFDPATIRTVKNVIEQLGPPEKVYYSFAVRGGEMLELLPRMRHNNDQDNNHPPHKVEIRLLYPNRGVDFISKAPEKKLRSDTPVLGQDCYLPVDLAIRMEQLPRGYSGGFGDRVVLKEDWSGFNNSVR
jgi:hypothetical protein